MVLVFHIIIALVSLIGATLSWARPTRAVRATTYLTTFFAVLSGTYLTVTNNSHLIQACTTGLLYLTAVGVQLAFAHHRARHAS